MLVRSLYHYNHSYFKMLKSIGKSLHSIKQPFLQLFHFKGGKKSKNVCEEYKLTLYICTSYCFKEKNLHHLDKNLAGYFARKKPNTVSYKIGNLHLLNSTYLSFVVSLRCFLKELIHTKRKLGRFLSTIKYYTNLCI